MGKRSLEDRFWGKVDKGGPDDCWLWTGARIPNGYGTLQRRGEDGSRLAHRIAYELLIGPIPEGMQLDHVRDRGCIHRHCVNPAHLEPVTQRVNIHRGNGIAAREAAKTHCHKGHLLAGDNLYIYPNGKRRCRQCRRESEGRA